MLIQCIPLMITMTEEEERTQEHSVFIVRQRPKEYPLTEQQKQFRQVLETCGITKGISRDELVDKMINCVPQAWEKIRATQGEKTIVDERASTGEKTT